MPPMKSYLFENKLERLQLITVYYDGKCGLCSKEINHYKNIAPENIFIWCDIASEPGPFTSKGYSLSEGLKNLHAEDHAGKFHIGVDAFILIWRELKYWKFLAIIVSLPLIKSIANFFYDSFASWRFSKLSHCQIALKKEGS